MAMYQLTGSISGLRSPALIVALEGWVDAGSAATLAAEHVARDGELVAAFDADVLFDFRARRPTIDIVDGRFTAIHWPTLTVTRVAIPDRDLLVMTGHEPDYAWRSFSAAVTEFAQKVGVTQLVSLGGIPWAVPHTRPTSLLTTATDRSALLDDDQVSEGPVRVPGAAVTVVDMALAEHGIPTVGLWAQVPHYVTSTYPPAVIALIERLGRQFGFTFPLGDLVRESHEARSQLDAALEERPEVQEYIGRLEGLSDQGAAPAVPSGDEIAAEIERFLRNEGS